MLGEIALIRFPTKVGNYVKALNPVCILEALYTSTDIQAPISGTLAQINPLVQEKPEMVLEDPEGDGWLCDIEFDNLPRKYNDNGALTRYGLITSDEYEKFVAGLKPTRSKGIQLAVDELAFLDPKDVSCLYLEKEEMDEVLHWDDVDVVAWISTKFGTTSIATGLTIEDIRQWSPVLVFPVLEAKQRSRIHRLLAQLGVAALSRGTDRIIYAKRPLIDLKVDRTIRNNVVIPGNIPTA